MEMHLHNRREAAREKVAIEYRNVSDDENQPTKEELDTLEIIKNCNAIYTDAKRAREPFETFDICWDLFVGNVWPKNWPGWRATITVNRIRAYITFIQAIMTDNKPRMSVEPLLEGSEDAADLLHKLTDRDWDENNMQHKVAIFVLYGLLWGTGFMKITYDPYADGGRGKHCAAPVVPYRIYTNATATCVEDAEFIIHEEEQTMGWLRRNFPDKYEQCKRLGGNRKGDTNEVDRDFIHEGDSSGRMRVISAQNINGVIQPPQVYGPNPAYEQYARETCDVKEFWLHDDSQEEYQRQVVENGEAKMEPVVGDNGEYVFQITGIKTVPSEIDGTPVHMPIRTPKMQPVMESAWRAKYPNGRLVILAGMKVLLRDIPGPFQIDGFPFASWKDYDVGNFWGFGEPMALKDCQLASNQILSRLHDILNKIGNPQYKVKKDGGVNTQLMTNKPGLLIEMDEMDALAPLEKPNVPSEFFELFNMVNKGMGDVTGLPDSVMGSMPAGNTAFGTIDQLQESGAAPIRQKVRNFENGLARIGKLRVQLIQQFDNGSRPIRIAQDRAPVNGANVVEPFSNSSVQFRSYKKADLQGTVEFGVVPISSLSTSPAGTWNRWMTMFEKGLIDRRWWHTKNRIEGWRTELPRVEATEVAKAAQEAAAKRASKVQPGPSKSTNSGKEVARRRAAPQSFVPTQAANAAVR